MTIKLGDQVKDPVSGTIGIAVGITTWLHGCRRISVQPPGVKKEDKQPYDCVIIDEPQLVVMTKKKVKRGSKKTGGPLSKSAISKY